MDVIIVSHADQTLYTTLLDNLSFGTWFSGRWKSRKRRCYNELVLHNLSGCGNYRMCGMKGSFGMYFPATTSFTWRYSDLIIVETYFDLVTPLD